jgi:DNA modification methylase
MDDANRIEFGDCRETMRRWAAHGVKAQTCVTSPPYFGLRDYGHDGQIGLEQTPEEYIAAMVDVFRCVRDVLADDGTLWVNIGDSYARAADKGGSGPGEKNEAYSDSYTLAQSAKVGSSDGAVGRAARPGTRAMSDGLKPKDLIGIPWALAFALRADGWYLRQDIIWHKPNPMPESVRDRCTKAHEYIFLLSKSDRYFFNNEAMKEPVAANTVSRLAQDVENQRGSNRVPGKTNGPMKAVGNGETRNRRSVWSVATRPYKGAHFATFPPALIEPCILAGSRPGDVVLDPFMGSGTTAAAAIHHGRQYLGCELNPAYADLQNERIAAATNEKRNTRRNLDLFDDALPVANECPRTVAETLAKAMWSDYGRAQARAGSLS